MPKRLIDISTNYSDVAYDKLPDERLKRVCDISSDFY